MKRMVKTSLNVGAHLTPKEAPWRTTWVAVMSAWLSVRRKPSSVKMSLVVGSQSSDAR
jgi:hypothetical protein